MYWICRSAGSMARNHICPQNSCARPNFPPKSTCTVTALSSSKWRLVCPSTAAKGHRGSSSCEIFSWLLTLRLCTNSWTRMVAKSWRRKCLIILFFLGSGARRWRLRSGRRWTRFIPLWMTAASDFGNVSLVTFEKFYQNIFLLFWCKFNDFWSVFECYCTVSDCW